MAEMMVALVILAVLTAIAAPRFSRLVSVLRSRSAVDQLSSDLAYTRMMAVRRGRTASLRFLDTSQGHYAVTIDGTTVDTLKQSNLSTEYPGISVASSGGARIAFDSRGLRTGSAVTDTVSVTRNGVTQKLYVTRLGRISR